MSASPFDDPAIRTRIEVEVARIQARWLEEDAEPTEGYYDTKTVQTLGESLDSHAKAYLTEPQKHAVGLERPRIVMDALVTLARMAVTSSAMLEVESARKRGRGKGKTLVTFWPGLKADAMPVFHDSLPGDC